MSHGELAQVDETRRSAAIHKRLSVRTKLIARWVRVISALWSGVISSGSSSTDANHRRATGDGITTMDVMVMDVAAGATDTGATYPTSSDAGPAGTSWTTKPTGSTAGPGKGVRGKRHDEHDAHNGGYQ